jgi:hypothetical protein
MRAGRNIFGWRRLNKSVAIFLLVFQSVFLNIIVPGHTRGVITLSGKVTVGSIADLGCPFCPQPIRKDPKKAPTSQDRAQCAICQLAIRITHAPVIDFRLGELGLLEVVPPSVREAAPVCMVILVPHCRGPPCPAV